MIPSDLETLRKIMSDRRVWVGVGTVSEKETTKDKSVMRARVKLLPDDHQIIARVTWDAVGPDAGNFGPLSVDDLVLVVYVDGSEDDAYIIRRLSSRSDTLPQQAIDNHTISKSLDGKKAILWGDLAANIVSPARVNIGKTDANVTEPLVLGLVLKSFLSDFFDLILNSNQIGVCAVGPVFLDPTIRAQMVLQKNQYITTAATNILSQLSFTER